MENLHFGWFNDPFEVAAIAQQQPFQTFSDTPASEIGDIPDSYFAWKVFENVTRSKMLNENQGSIGSCVSFGTAAAIECTMIHEIASGSNEEFREICQEVIYGGSRVEIGGNRISGDGSIGAWAAQFVTKYGFLDRGVYLSGKYDLSKYDVSRCKLWGTKGVPDDLEPEVRKHPVKTITLIKTWDEAKKALAQGYGISVCSNQGFKMVRDKDGFCTDSGKWGHCMALIGYRTKGREGGFIKNSWGPDAMTGPMGEGDGPPSGFWADSAVVDRMLRAGDSWAFSAVEGFPKKDVIDWSTI